MSELHYCVPIVPFTPNYITDSQLYLSIPFILRQYYLCIVIATRNGLSPEYSDLSPNPILNILLFSCYFGMVLHTETQARV